MYATKEQSEEDGLFLLNTRVVPQHLKTSSDANQRWNLATLGILARSGVIKWDYIRGKAAHSELTNPSDYERSDIAIRLLKPGFFKDDFWKNIEVDRKIFQTRTADNYKSLLKVLEGKACTGEIIASTYSLPNANCVTACAGCAYCREQGNPKTRGTRGITPPPTILTKNERFNEFAFVDNKNVLSPRIICGLGNDLFEITRRKRRKILDLLISKMDIKLLASNELIRHEIYADLKPGQQNLMWENTENFDYSINPKVETLVFIDPNSTDLLNVTSDDLPFVVILGKQTFVSSEKPLADQEGFYPYDDWKRILESI